MSTTIKQAIDGFLLSCKVEGKSYGTIECYSDKLKGFLWYATNYNWPDDISAITTQHIREFLAYLRDTDHLTCPPKRSTSDDHYAPFLRNSSKMIPSLRIGFDHGMSNSMVVCWQLSPERDDPSLHAGVLLT